MLTCELVRFVLTVTCRAAQRHSNVAALALILHDNYSQPNRHRRSKEAYQMHLTGNQIRFSIFIVKSFGQDDDDAPSTSGYAPHQSERVPEPNSSSCVPSPTCGIIVSPLLFRRYRKRACYPHLSTASQHPSLHCHLRWLSTQESLETAALGHNPAAD